MANEQTEKYDDLKAQLELEASRADRLEQELRGVRAEMNTLKLHLRLKLQVSEVYELKEELRELRSEVIALKQYILFSADRNDATKPNLSWENFARQAEHLSVKELACVIHGGDLEASTPHHRRAPSLNINARSLASPHRARFSGLPQTDHRYLTSPKGKAAADTEGVSPRASSKLKHQLASWSSPPYPVKRAPTSYNQLTSGRIEANKDSASESSEASATSMSSSEDDSEIPHLRSTLIAKPTALSRKPDGRRTPEQAEEKPEPMFPSQSSPLESLHDSIGKTPSHATPIPQSPSRQ
ncbi:hypothetical protein DL769_002722 [Monosporascus sp. CRB-8-3]|nr:hypothetical protein DL769_002722 [Monosporascus sp. CRB-8-3]